MDWMQIVDWMVPVLVALGAVALDRYLAGRWERARVERRRREDVLDALGALVRASGELWAALLSADIHRRRSDVPVAGLFVGPFDHAAWAREVGSQVIELEVALARFTVHVGDGHAASVARTYVEEGRQMTKTLIDVLDGSAAGEPPSEDDWREWKDRRDALYVAVSDHVAHEGNERT